MEKRTFVKLERLQDISYGDETAEQRDAWLKNVYSSVGTNGVTFASEEDNNVMEDFALEEMDFASDEITFYDFMGSAYEEERFYERNITIFKNKETCNLYVLYTGDEMFDI